MVIFVPPDEAVYQPFKVYESVVVDVVFVDVGVTEPPLALNVTVRVAVDVELFLVAVGNVPNVE